MDINTGHTLAMLIVSVVSIAGSISMIVPFIFFPELSRKPRYEVLICCAVSNILYAMGTIPGNPRDGSFACTFMGFFSNAFSLCTCFWIYYIIYMIYDILVNENKFTLGFSAHFICWIIPIFLTVIPLVNTSYGTTEGSGWCWLKPHKNTPDWLLQFYYWVTFYGWIWIGILLSFVALAMVQYGSAKKLSDTQEQIHSIVHRLCWYPFVVTISWGVCTVNDTLLASLSPSQYESFKGIDTVNYISDVMPCCQGVLFSIVFWLTMDDIRLKLYARFFGTETSSSSKSRTIKGKTDTNVIIVSPHKPHSLVVTKTASSSDRKHPYISMNSGSGPTSPRVEPLLGSEKNELDETIA